MKTGKTLKLNRQDLSKIQDYVAESLAMERGELKSNTNIERLEAVEYKRQQEELKLKKITLELQELEQKKNKLFTTNNELRERKQQHTKRIEHLIQRLAKSEDLASIQKEYTEGEIIIGNYSLTQGIHKLNEEIRELEEQFKSIF
jgi:hypothetical protein